MPRARSSALLSLAGVAVALIALTACARATYEGPDAADEGPIDARADAATDATPDAPGSQCSRQPCSILPQCGCADNTAAPVCDLDFQNLATGATKCRADNFHGTETTVCTMAATCAAEHVCVGRCRRYCDDDDDCPGPGGLCIIKLNSGATEVPGVTTCTTDCVPSQAANLTCPATWGCHIYREAAGAQRYLTDCAPTPASGGAVGAVCANNDACRPGLDCVNLNPGGPQCRPTCMCPGGNCAAGLCAGGTGSCRAYTTPVVIGGVTYGACF
jgi:hypothetical protein